MNYPLVSLMMTLFLIDLTASASAQESNIGRLDTVSSAGKTRAELRIDLANMVGPAQNRYTFKHIEEFLPIKTIDAGKGAPFVFQRALIQLDLEKIPFDFDDPVTHDVTSRSVAQMLRQTRTDALIVLKDGKIAYENYFDSQNNRTRHQMMSVTKSLAGMLAASLVAEGKLEPNAKVVDYIPELKNSAYGDATVHQVMDMTIGVKYSEAYDDPNSEVAGYGLALGAFPVPASYAGSRTIRAFLPTLRKEGAHGAAFHYVTANTDVLCWLSERAMGVPFEDMVGDAVWSKIGASRDAYVVVDPAGVASCGGGFNATALDLAKVGQMLLDGGRFNGNQILPTDAVKSIRKGGDRNAFAKSIEGQTSMKGWSYHDQFWFRHDADRAFTAIGIYGQWLYIDPVAKVVIVKQSSLPQADNSEVDAYTLAGFDAIIRSLSR